MEYQPLSPETLLELEKQVTRGKIKINVADHESLLGTVSDTCHILLVEFAKLTTKLASATSLEEVKSAATQANSLVGHITTKVDEGSLTFPYQQKGMENVLQEIEGRAMGVSEVLSKSAK
ncbi:MULTISPECIES: hypothetical protein [Pseudoalteromonas]|uniref:Uncharacterized protein n=1 Tax=Pseudoalteromonas amylolytica TaxID=1859457 RepID=A0A1S1MWK6_9GAMM|nr:MULTISPECIES: hypothetical protein [Pseudoalteromonas]OHU87839.1 hypothetical protein BFC16_10525 [Pseudoalteromonas sp. JW3]OHU91279.1 hypothetical protein BET10_10645 [Pseudoalteromonas amylolytica]